MRNTNTCHNPLLYPTLCYNSLEFKLLVICCKEDEGSSLLVGDLREYKQNLPPLPPMKSVQQYLRNHFSADVVKYGADLPILGATVDPDE